MSNIRIFECDKCKSKIIIENELIVFLGKDGKCIHCTGKMLEVNSCDTIEALYRKVGFFGLNWRSDDIVSKTEELLNITPSEIQINEIIDDIMNTECTNGINWDTIEDSIYKYFNTESEK